MDRPSKLPGLIFGPVLFLVLMLFVQPPAVFSNEGWTVIALTVWMMTWWITEALPLPVTALLPIIFLPSFEVMPLKDVTMGYGHPVVFLFVGGFVIAQAMEKYQLHKRAALSILKFTGDHANGIIFGFMLSSALMSMWMPNTAAAVLMLPIGLAICEVIFNDSQRYDDRKKTHFKITIMLSIAFGANIGGMATLIGTPTNAILAAFVSDQFGISITFWKWLMVGFPFAALLLLSGWAVLTHLVYPNKMGHIENAQPLIQKEIDALGSIKHEEKITAFIFLTTISLWIFKGLLPFQIHDASIAIFGAVLCFSLPAKNGLLLNTRDLPKIPWAILFLFGGGLALANAIQNTGLSDLIAQGLSTQDNIEIIGFIIMTVMVILLMTEFIGNVPVITVMLPVLTGVAIAFELNPLTIIVPATLAASCAFMLPTATPPNAVVFSSGHLRVVHMIKAGVLMNALAIILLSILALFWFPQILGINLR